MSIRTVLSHLCFVASLVLVNEALSSEKANTFWTWWMVAWSAFYGIAVVCGEDKK